MAESKIIPFPSSFPESGGGGQFPLSMKSDLVEKASEVIQDPQMLINAVSQRVRQLNMGRPSLVRPPIGERYGAADIALLEIIEGKIIISPAVD